MGSSSQWPVVSFELIDLVTSVINTNLLLSKITYKWGQKQSYNRNWSITKGFLHKFCTTKLSCCQCCQKNMINMMNTNPHKALYCSSASRHLQSHPDSAAFVCTPIPHKPSDEQKKCSSGRPCDLMPWPYHGNLTTKHTTTKSQLEDNVPEPEPTQAPSCQVLSSLRS